MPVSRLDPELLLKLRLAQARRPTELEDIGQFAGTLGTTLGGIEQARLAREEAQRKARLGEFQLQAAPLELEGTQLGLEKSKSDLAVGKEKQRIAALPIPEWMVGPLSEITGTKKELLRKITLGESSASGFDPDTIIRYMAEQKKGGGKAALQLEKDRLEVERVYTAYLAAKDKLGTREEEMDEKLSGILDPKTREIRTEIQRRKFTESLASMDKSILAKIKSMAKRIDPSVVRDIFAGEEALLSLAFPAPKAPSSPPGRVGEVLQAVAKTVPGATSQDRKEFDEDMAEFQRTLSVLRDFRKTNKLTPDEFNSGADQGLRMLEQKYPSFRGEIRKIPLRF